MATPSNTRSTTDTFSQSLLEQLPIAIALLDCDFCLRWVSRHWLEMYGHTESVIGRSIDELFSAGICKTTYQRCLAEAVSDRIEAAVPQPDGSIRWYQQEVRPWQENGTTAGVLLVCEDITDRKHTAEQEQFLRSVYNGLQQAIFVWDISDSEVRSAGWNSTAEAIVGTSTCKSIGKSPEEVFGPVEGALVRHNLLGCAAAKTVISHEDVLSFGGHDRWWLSSLNPVHDADGHVYRIVGTGVSIDDRKQAELALQEREQRLRDINSVVPGAIYQYQWNLQTGEAKFTYLSSKARDLFGLEESQLLESDNPILALIHPDDVSRVVEKIVHLVQHHDRWFDEFRVVLPSGIEKWIRGQAEPAEAPDGFSIHNGIFIDITDRRQAEDALRYSEQRFRDVSEAAGEYIWEIDAAGTYTFVTGKVKGVKGYEPSDLLGHTPFEFMPPDDVETVAAIVQTAAAIKSTFKIEHRNISPAGETLWEEVSGLPLFDDSGEMIGFRGVGLSITDRKRSQAQLHEQTQQLQAALSDLQQTQAQLIQTEKMSSLGQLVAGIAHEINNPVSFIYGNIGHASDYISALLNLIALYQQHYPHPAAAIETAAEAIDLEFVTEDLPKLLASMRVGAERIQAIVRALRTFSRMDEAEVKTVNIHDGIDSTLMILQSRLKPTAGHRGIDIIRDYGDLPLIECYAGQLNQVFMNVLSNAIDALEDAMTQGKWDAETHSAPQIHVCTEQVGDRVVIRIRDNGPGMRESVRKRLFEPFFTTKAIGKGTGLGLSISYQVVVDRHGGQLTCTSAPGEGAEFVIRLPLGRRRGL